jgi:hypothetical protein
MDYVTHGIQGGLFYGILAKLLILLLSLIGIHISPWFAIVLFIWGLIEGSWPDTGDWIIARMGYAPRWFWYVKYHTPFEYEKMVWGKLPAFLLHVKYVDPIFHTKPDSISQEEWDSGKPGVRNWFKRLWWLAFIYWGTALLGLYIFFWVL